MPAELDVDDSGDESQWGEVGRSCRYRLTGAIVHVDPILEGDEAEEVVGAAEGHYVTVIRSLDARFAACTPSTKEELKEDAGLLPQDESKGGSWTEIDDDVVRRLDCLVEDVPRAISGCEPLERERERRYAMLVVCSRVIYSQTK